MLLVFANKVTKRFLYSADLVLKQLCGFEISIADDESAFQKHEGPKVFYGHKNFSDALCIEPSGLLEEKGIRTQNISVSKWNNLPTLFANKNSEIPFDLFSATFYLTSRYEEYLPFIADIYHRFEAENSLALQHNFIEIPIVNLWALELRKIILQRSPNLPYRKNSYKYISTIDIDNAWAFKHKGLMRTTGAFSKSLLRGNFKEIRERLNTLLGRKPDPYFTYEYLLGLKKKYETEQVYFFLLGNYSEYDRNVSSNHPALQNLIKHIADYAKIGIHPSFASNNEPVKLSIEIARLQNISKTPAVRSRQHFLKLHFPGTYRHLLNCGIREDFTMGYASRIGFRAGISTPFFWYDLETEQITDLTIYPFCIMDATLRFYMNLDPGTAMELSCKMIQKLKESEGSCITLWHNESVSNWNLWEGWQELYEKITDFAAR